MVIMINNSDNKINNLSNNNINISISNLFKEFSNKLINEVIKKTKLLIKDCITLKSK